MKTFTLAFAALLAVSCSSAPKEPPPQAEVPPPCLSLRVTKYFDGEREKNDGTVWLSMNTESVTGISEDPAPGCKQLDVSKLYVLPGLVDGHTHVFLTDRTKGGDFSKELESHARTSMATRKQEANEHLRSLLLSGITTIRDLGNSGQFLDVEFRDSPTAVHSPRIFASGPGIATGKAQFPESASAQLVNQEYKIVRQIGDVDRAIKDLAAKKVSLVKIYADNEPQRDTMNQDLLDAAVKFAHQKGLRITAHATNDASARRAIRAGVDAIEHGTGLSTETLSSMSEARIVLVPTDFGKKSCQAMARHNPDNPLENCGSRRIEDSRRLMNARERGVDIAFGSDMYMELDGDLKGSGPATLDSLVAYVDEGLYPIEAIRAATGNSRRLFGDERLGVLREGSYPDLVAYETSPLRSIEAIRKPKLVIKGGRLVCGADAPQECK